jgi:hypothetical protein
MAMALGRVVGAQGLDVASISQRIENHLRLAMEELLRLRTAHPDRALDEIVHAGQGTLLQPL